MVNHQMRRLDHRFVFDQRLITGLSLINAWPASTQRQRSLYHEADSLMGLNRSGGMKIFLAAMVPFAAPGGG